MVLTRRELLRLAGAGVGTVVGGSLLAACGGADPAGPVPGAGTGPARRGGTVRLAFVGGGAAESLDPFAAYSPADLARGLVVFDRLFTVTDGKTTPALAVSARLEPDARSSVLTLRDGVTWHDGSSLTAGDAAAGLARLVAPATRYASELSLYLDIANVEVTGELTLRVPTFASGRGPGRAAGRRIDDRGEQRRVVRAGTGRGHRSRPGDGVRTRPRGTAGPQRRLLGR